MHLQQHAGFGSGQTLVQPDHRHLDEVRRGSLDGGVRRGAFAVAADPGVPGTDLGDVPPAPEQRLDVVPVPCQLLHLLEVGSDTREPLEVSVDEFARLRPRDAELLGERERPLAVNGREVDRLRLLAHGRRDVVRRDPEDAGRRLPVDVPLRPEGFHERIVPREMRHHAEFDLGVVRPREQVAGSGDEPLPDLAPQRPPDRDVLQVGVRGGESAGRGDGLVEAGVDAPPVVDEAGEHAHVRAVQLVEFPVLEDESGKFVAHGRELFEHGLVRRGAGLRLLEDRQRELVEEKGPHLRHGAEIDLGPGDLVDLRAHGVEIAVQAGAQLTEEVEVDRDARPFHAREDGDERHLDLAEEAAHPGAHEVGFVDLREAVKESGAGAGPYGDAPRLDGRERETVPPGPRDGVARLQRDAQAVGAEGGEGAVAAGRIQAVGGDLRVEGVVVLEAPQFDAVPAQELGGVLEVVPEFRGVRGEQFPQASHVGRRQPRQADRFARVEGEGRVSRRIMLDLRGPVPEGQVEGAGVGGGDREADEIGAERIVRAARDEESDSRGFRALGQQSAHPIRVGDDIHLRGEALGLGRRSLQLPQQIVELQFAEDGRGLFGVQRP